MITISWLVVGVAVWMMQICQRQTRIYGTKGQLDGDGEKWTKTLFGAGGGGGLNTTTVYPCDDGLSHTNSKYLSFSLTSIFSSVIIIILIFLSFSSSFSSSYQTGRSWKRRSWANGSVCCQLCEC